MAFSLPQVESNFQLSPLPNLDIEQGLDKTVPVDIYDKAFESSWDFLVAYMRLAGIGLLLSTLAIYVKPLQEHSNPIQSQFFDNSLRVSNFNISDGELSTNHDVSLTLIDVMDDNNIRMGITEAALMHKENHEEKRINFKFSTVGLEKEQPTVDDTMIQDNAEDCKKGMIRSNIHADLPMGLGYI